MKVSEESLENIIGGKKERLKKKWKIQINNMEFQ
jgi:hypothetical protein